MSVPRVFVLGLCVGVGVVGGLVLSGRLSATQSSFAAPKPAVAFTRSGAAPGPIVPMPDLSPVAERAVLASVNISSVTNVPTDPLYRMMGGDSVIPQTSLGSGVIVSADGYILTNSHVAQSSNAAIEVTLPDNRSLPAKVVGFDGLSDLALLKVSATGLNPLPWGDSSKLRVAEWVLAVGNPYQFSQTVTLGIVSTVNRHDPELNVYTDFIQTDAAINPGNSGGPLVNARGELVGVNTMIYSQTGGYQGIGFAIPANLAQEIMSELKATGQIRRGSIGLDRGLTNNTAPFAQANNLAVSKGVVIVAPVRGRAADAGFKYGDIIVSYEGTAVETSDQLQRLMAKSPIGSTATVEVIHYGERRQTTIRVPVSQMVPRVR
jgi:S1-C subfamily serine protease